MTYLRLFRQERPGQRRELSAKNQHKKARIITAVGEDEEK